MPFPRSLASVLLVCGSFMLVACQEEAPVQAAATPQVTVAKPLVKPISDWDGFVGQFEAVQYVEVMPRVTGYLVEVGFEDGQRVESGDLLFRIDPRPFEAALNEARSRVRSAETRLENTSKELQRAEGLLEFQAVSQEEFDALTAASLTAEADLEAARAAMVVAELNLDFTRVTAPVTGRVSSRRVDVGNVVKADDTMLTTIVTMDPIHFSFQGSEAAFLRYMRRNPEGLIGAPVRIRLQDEQEYRWEGRLDFMDNAISTGSGTIRGRARLDNPDGFLLPGMFGHMELQASAEYDGILVPDSAIATRGPQRLVYVVNSDNVIEARDIELGPLHLGLRVIRSGLEGSERVVINGVQRAFPGITVAATERSIDDPAASSAR